MSIVLLVGLNGAGKDTIANAISLSGKDIQILSGSRILMRALGEDVPSILANTPVSRKAYIHLEQTSVDDKLAIIDKDFRQILEACKRSQTTYLICSHLLVPVRTGRKLDLQNQVRDWYPNVFDAAIYVDVSNTTLLERWLNDQGNGIRDRGEADAMTMTLIEQQSRSIWERLKISLGPERCLTVDNNNRIPQEPAWEVVNFLESRGIFVTQELHINNR